MDANEKAWRNAIAAQVKRNCTLSLPDGSIVPDAAVNAVADWIQNPPDWSYFKAPNS